MPASDPRRGRPARAGRGRRRVSRVLPPVRPDGSLLRPVLAPDDPALLRHGWGPFWSAFSGSSPTRGVYSYPDIDATGVGWFNADDGRLRPDQEGIPGSHRSGAARAAR